MKHTRLQHLRWAAGWVFLVLLSCSGQVDHASPPPCPSGYEPSGEACVDLDECALPASPCVPDAVCTNTQGSYQCTCKPGFVGDGQADGAGCAPAGGCSDAPCQHGGVCTEDASGYTCDCTGTGYTGPHCAQPEEPPLPSCQPSPCLHGGVCLETDAGGRCDCEGTGYTGARCELRLLDPVAYWPFDDEHGRCSLDRSSRGNDIYRATIDATAQPVWESSCPGGTGGCYRFPAGAHLEAPFFDAHRFPAAGDFTLVARIQADDASSPAEIIHGPRYAPCDPALRPETCPEVRKTHPNHYAFRFYLNGNALWLCTWLGVDPACATIAYPPSLTGQWVRAVGWKEGDTLCLSLDDGAPSCTAVGAPTDPAPPPAGQLFVGAHPSGVNPFSGHLDDLMIFDRGLSAEERRDLLAGNAAVDTCEVGDGGCCGNGVCDAGESVGTCVADCAQTAWEEKFLREYFSRRTYYTVSRQNPGFAYWTNSRVRPFMDLYEATQQPFYFDTALAQAKAAIRLQKDVTGDGVREWPCFDDSYGCNAGTGAKNGLSAERAARAITGLARMIHRYPALAAHRTWATNAALNIQSTLINNPIYRIRYDDTGYTSPETYPLPTAPVHHIVSHAAIVLFNLNEVLNGGGPSGSYYLGFRRRAQHLKGSLLPNPGGAGVAWGSIQCQALSQAPECYVGWDEVVSRSYFCGDPTDPSHIYCFPMDSAHSTDFVDAAVQLHDAGHVFTAADLAQLAATFQQVMLKQDPATLEHYFSTHIDGNDQPAPSAGQDCSGCAQAVTDWYSAGAAQGSVPGCIAYCSALPAFWTRGHLAPGWTALARDNAALQQVLAAMDANTTADYVLPWSLSLRYYAQLALIGAPEPAAP